MKLIVDAGSTKTDWIFTDNYLKIKELKTQGINPFYQTSDEIVKMLTSELLPHCNAHEVQQIYFYGAGCTLERRSVVQTALQTIFENAKIEVESDLMAAARALCQHNQGIACILGTGSNSCFYDGEKIVQNTSPLGYILGDEGSGATMGKQLVSDVLKRQLPEHVAEAFAEKHQLTATEAVERVYRQPFPNRYLAQFVPFLAEHIAEPYCYNLVFDSFNDFFTRNIVHYPDFREQPIAFVGSVAHHFADVLEVAAYDFGLNFSHIAKSPIEGLLQYHEE